MRAVETMQANGRATTAATRRRDNQRLDWAHADDNKAKKGLRRAEANFARLTSTTTAKFLCLCGFSAAAERASDHYGELCSISQECWWFSRPVPPSCAQEQ